MTPAEDLRRAQQAVLERIAAACARAGRDPAGVRLLPISKAVPVERLRHAIAAGIEAFGENRVQEAEAKAAELPAARWQLVGRLQSNKARRALAVFEVIQSVDSVELAHRLAAAAQEAGHRDPYPVYLQVNVDDDPAKTGFAPDAMLGALAALAELAPLELRGLMTVGRLVARPEESRPTFVRLRRLSEELRRSTQALGGGLSMGMSDDFEVAVEEGATLVRVGRAIFGERPPA